MTSKGNEAKSKMKQPSDMTATCEYNNNSGSCQYKNNNTVTVYPFLNINLIIYFNNI